MQYEFYVLFWIDICRGSSFYYKQLFNHQYYCYCKYFIRLPLSIQLKAKHNDLIECLSFDLLYFLNSDFFHQPPLTYPLISILHQLLDANKQEMFVLLSFDLFVCLIPRNLPYYCVLAPRFHHLFLLQSFLESLFLHLVSPFRKVGKHDILLMFPLCDFVHNFDIFEFLCLQIHIDHYLPLLKQLLAESQDSKSLFQSIRVLVLRVPQAEKAMLNEPLL